MKSYTVEIKRISYVSFTVDALDKEHAEQSAWAAVESGYFGDSDDASWEIESIDPIFMREQA